MDVKPANQSEDLGVTFCQLICGLIFVSACYYHLRRIRQLRHCLDKRLNRVSACCKIDFAISHLWIMRFHWLLCHQRRLSSPPPTSRPVSHVLREHWLPIRERVIIHGCLMVNQWNCADIHDWHGHAQSRSVSSPFCRRGIV